MILKFIETHLEVFIYAIFHFVSMLFYSYLEYKVGKDKNRPENSYAEILINKLFGSKK
jgi:hypothetical protein